MPTGAVQQAAAPTPYRHGEIPLEVGASLTPEQVNRLLGANIIKGEHGFSGYGSTADIDADFAKAAASQEAWNQEYGSDPANSGLNQENVFRPGSMTVLLPGGRGREVAYAQLTRDAQGNYGIGELGGHTSPEDALRNRVYGRDNDLLGTINQGWDFLAKALPTIVGTFVGGPAGAAAANAAVSGRIDPAQMAKTYALSWLGGQAGDLAQTAGLGSTATGAVRGLVGSGGNPIGALTGAAGGYLDDFNMMTDDARQLAAQGIPQSQISEILGQTYGDSWTNYLAQASGAVQGLTGGLVNPTRMATGAIRGAVGDLLGGGSGGGSRSSGGSQGSSGGVGGGLGGIESALPLLALMSQQKPKEDEEMDSMTAVEAALAAMQPQGENYAG